MNVMKKYWDTVYLWYLVLTPLACLSAAIYYTTGKCCGIYEHTSWNCVLVFDGSQLIYLLAAGILIFMKKKEKLAADIFFQVLCWYITVILLLQFSMIMLWFPKNFTWGCTFLFLLVIMFFFDRKIIFLNLCGYLTIAMIAHLLYPREHLSDGSGISVESLVFRLIIFLLYSILLLAITFYADKFIRRLQFEEDENAFLAQRQLAYYQNLNLMDKELRKFRHDIKNHFLCMQDLTEKGKYPELQQYFSDLVDSYSQSGQIYFSGNVIVDAVLNYDISHLCGEQVRPVIYGRLPDITTVTSMDLCTVFSNMLSNAIKGANALEQENELIIRFQGGNRFFSIYIANQVSREKRGGQDISEKKGREARSDREKRGDRRDDINHDINHDRNHGHGIRNIEEITDKYEGVFEQGRKEETGYFVMQVYLPI